jgi:phosphoenolpyruvate-protein phosphotransferase
MKMKTESIPGPGATMSGTTICPGIAVGVGFVMKPINLAVLETSRFPVEDVGKEIGRLEHAVRLTRAQLTEIALRLRHDDNAAGILEAQQHILDDCGFLCEIKADVHRQKCNVEHVLSKRIKMYEQQFSVIGDDALRTRILDIQDVYHRILRNLLDIEHVRSNPMTRVASPVILVAQRLLPSDIALLDSEKLLGIILEEGNKLSHVSIMTKSLGIPAVIGVTGICRQLRTGNALILDAIKGRVVLRPLPEESARYGRIRERLSSLSRVREARRPLECKTADGTAIALVANVGSIREAEEAYACGAGGIGLLRSEFFYLARANQPTVKEEQEFYTAVIATMKGRPVTIRLLDIGADKALPCLAPLNEENPQLGVRGIRYLLAHLDLFKNHLRAIVRAAGAGPLDLLIPFVTDADDVLKTKDLLARLCGEERRDPGNIRVGIMVEIPAVALYPHRFFPLVDFINIGTNDLAQYLFAADRSESAVDRYRRGDHPVLLRVLSTCMAAARKYGREVTLCGEIASDPALAKVLVGLGATRLSMPPGAIPRVRDALAGASIKNLKKQAGSALLLDTPIE